MNKPKINYKIKVIENVGNFLKSNDPKDIVSAYLSEYDIVLNIIQNDKIVQKYKELQSRKNEKDCSQFEKIIAEDTFKRYLNDTLVNRKELLLKIFDMLNINNIDDNFYQLLYLTNVNLDGSVFVNGKQKFFSDAKEIIDDVDIRTLYQNNDDINTQTLYQNINEINVLISVDSRFVEGIFI